MMPFNLHVQVFLHVWMGNMNIAMEQIEEYVNGQLKNKYGDSFIHRNTGNLNDCLAILLWLFNFVFFVYTIFYWYDNDLDISFDAVL